MIITITESASPTVHKKTFNYPEDAREYIEDLWNSKLMKALPDDDDSFVMLQEDDDEVEEGRWSIDFHTESELSDEAGQLVDQWLKETNLKDESDKIMAVVSATANVQL